MLAFIVTNSKSINLILNGKTHNIEPDQPWYSKVVAYLKAWKSSDDKEAVEKELEDFLVSTVNPLQGHCEIVNGQVCLNGKPLHNVIASRILEIDSLGLPPEPMLQFLENVMLNPSEASRNELYDFLQHRNLPITEDGCFLAYKAVCEDFLDKYSRTIDNSPGQIVEFSRSEVDDNRDHECSHGLHVGAMEYVRAYGHDYTDKFVIVKINPRDAVSVPLDHSAQKLRVCRYEVLMEISRDQVLELPVYSSTGEQCNLDSSSFDGDDWYDVDYDDEDYEGDDCDNEDCGNYCGCVPVDKSDELSQLEKASLTRARAVQYDELYTRDAVCRLAAERGVIASAEAGRRLGKLAVCALLAENDEKDGRI
jgi:hypothetical protein